MDVVVVSQYVLVRLTNGLVTNIEEVCWVCVYWECVEFKVVSWFFFVFSDEYCLVSESCVCVNVLCVESEMFEEFFCVGSTTDSYFVSWVLSSFE